MVRTLVGPGGLRLAGAVVALVALSSPVRAQVRNPVVTYPSANRAITLECFVPDWPGRFPAVVMLHGSGGLEQATGPLFREAAASMARRGYVVVIPHFFEKTNHQPGARLAQGEHEAMTDAVRDAVAYVAAQREVDPNRLALMGLSMGSSLATITAVRDPRIKAVASWSGAYPPVAPNKKLPPLLILHGSKDQSTPLRYVQLYQKALTDQAMPHAVHIYKGSGHNFDADQFEDAGQRTAAFFDKYVKTARATPPGPAPTPTPSADPLGVLPSASP